MSGGGGVIARIDLDGTHLLRVSDLIYLLWIWLSGADPLAPCLLFLAHLYCHYLLLTPDDEFFAESSSNPLSLDEVLELAGIWRDLAFWGYMNGVAGLKSGSEDVRALFTRGVTRVAERK